MQLLKSNTITRFEYTQCLPHTFLSIKKIVFYHYLYLFNYIQIIHIILYSYIIR
jgi:hypothetical protein